MDTLKHKAERAAFGVAIDGALKYVRRDREQALLKIVDLAEKLWVIHLPRKTTIRFAT